MKYFAYCRKSSEEDTKQIQSLETQRDLLMQYAKKTELSLVEILQESRSAKTDGNRPVFSNMIERIKNSEAQGIVTAHIDRLSRNGIESGMIIKLFDEGFLKEIRTPSRTYSSAQDLLYMDFDFVFASHYSRNLSIRVKEGIETKLKNGIYPSRAPLGYINNNKKIYPDPIRAKYIQEAFKLYASGDYSLKQIMDSLYEQGFRTKIYNNKVSKSVIHRLLTDPVYYGAIRRKGKLYKGIHEPLISKTIFDQVQELLTEKNRSKRKTRDFLYRGYLKCAKCGCMYTSAIKKECFVYYYCTNGKKICDEHLKYLDDSSVKELINTLLKEFTLNKKLATLSLELYKNGVKSEVETTLHSATVLEQHILAVDEKINRLLDLYLDKKIDASVYERKERALENEKTELLLQKSRLKVQPPVNTLELLEELKIYACSLDKLFKEGDTIVRKDLLKAVLWNLELKNGEIKSVQYKLPFAYLQNLNKTHDLEIWRRGWDLNPRFH